MHMVVHMHVHKHIEALQLDLFHHSKRLDGGSAAAAVEVFEAASRRAV